jgi:hypothetical protein
MSLAPRCVICALVLITSGAAGIGCAAEPAISPENVLVHVRKLASDERRGRGEGTAVERGAAEYIAAELDDSGIATVAGTARLVEFPLAEPTGAVVTELAQAPVDKLPRSQNAVPPAGKPEKTLTMSHGELRVRFRDNSASPAELSGLDALFHSAAADFDAFDPDGKGSSAGLNFEHIISGHASAHNKFTPRHGRFDLYALDDRRSVVLVRRRENCPWDVSSTLEYRLAAPHAVDFSFRCTPHDAARFAPQGYAIFFFANYMNDVLSPAIHFLGIDEAGGQEKWIEADAPAGHPDWNQGGTYRAASAEPTLYAANHDFRLNSWSYDYPRFTRPFYYGRAARDMVFMLMFDRAHTAVDEIRFSLFKFKLPRQPRPAWDFQYVIHPVENDREYGFRGRLLWKKWVSAEDCLAEYTRWQSGQ